MAKSVFGGKQLAGTSAGVLVSLGCLSLSRRTWGRRNFEAPRANFAQFVQNAPIASSLSAPDMRTGCTGLTNMGLTLLQDPSTRPHGYGPCMSHRASQLIDPIHGDSDARGRPALFRTGNSQPACMLEATYQTSPAYSPNRLRMHKVSVKAGPSEQHSRLEMLQHSSGTMDNTFFQIPECRKSSQQLRI